jgi:hypothetical protein
MEGMGWIDVAQDGDRWWACVNTEIKTVGHKKCEELQVD